MKAFSTTISLLLLLSVQASFGQNAKQEFYSLTIYRISNSSQQERIDNFLKSAYLPALHRLGKNQIGVFKPIAKDTAAFGKLVYVLTPFSSLDEFQKITNALDNDAKLKQDGADYVNAAHNNAPYLRIETILMKAFARMPKMETPPLKGARNERIYELRSYEGPTEKLYKSKVKMFNDGDEVGLFKRLNFNAVFYAEVLSGSRMPNLIYMTTFENMASRDEHWKAFVEDPQWKKLLTIEEYKNTVSKADILLLFPTDYSDY
jgi:hypothetical protein